MLFADKDLYFLDFESNSSVDLTKYGSTIYTKFAGKTEADVGFEKGFNDSPTQILLMAAAYNDEPIKLYRDDAIARIKRDIQAAIDNPNVMFVAQNAMFEYEVITNVLELEVDISRFIDTLALANMLTLPSKLEGIGNVLGFPKLEVGKRLINLFCKYKLPRHISAYYNTEDYKLFKKYCIRDVAVTRKFWYDYGHYFTAVEHQVWIATCRINLEGLPVNSELIYHMDNMVKDIQKSNNVKCINICGLKTSQTKKLAEYCGMDSVNKVAIREVEEEWNDWRQGRGGKPPLTQAQYDVLMLRKENSLSSLSKLEAADRLNYDGRITNSFAYGGASRTLRWSGRGIQPQNLPRGFSEELLEENINKVWDNDTNITLSELSNCIRGIIEADKNYRLFVGDFSQIECRISAFLTGDQPLLDAFSQKRDPYKEMALKIYGGELEDITKDQRFMGKQLILACGYQMSGRKFCELLYDTYNVKITEAEAYDLVYIYRDAHPEIVDYWAKVEAAFFETYMTERPHKVGKIIFRKIPNTGCVTVQLLSGRKLYYWGVSFKDGGLRYLEPAKSNTSQVVRSIYGGALTGHICQATSRDITAVATLRLFKEGWHPVGFVHDEIICHDPESKALEDFERILLKPIKWATGIPIDGECFKAIRYQKR